MRPLSGPEAALLDGPRYAVFLRVWVENIAATLVNYNSVEGKNWIDSIQIDVDIDQPITGATIQLRREIDDPDDILSLSPLMDGSALNTSGPAIDIGRAIKIEVATVAVGATPSGGDWKNLLEGEIDDVDFAHTPMTISVRDQGGVLQDRFVETETPYGAVDGSVEVEEVIQDILDDASVGVTLVTPVSPGFAIKPYKQSRQPILEATNTLAALFGWDTRYRWGGSAWQFQLKDPDRAKTTPDRTIGPDRYLSVDQIKLSRTDVRNVIWLWYTDVVTGVRTKIEREDATSISRYGRRWGEIDLPASSPIDTAAEAEALADIILLDLKDPKAEQAIEMHFDWSVELNDLYRFEANGIHYDVDQDWAVVGYSHALSMQNHRTRIRVRGKPAGKYLGWQKMMNDPNQRPANAGPTLIVDAVPTQSDVTIDVRHTGVLTISIDGGLTFIDPATDPPGITAFPFTVARPDGSAGLPSFRWVFKASLNGQEVTHPVDIPATEAPAGPKPPPDGAYATVIPGATVVAIHGDYNTPITLTNMASARTELAARTRFVIIATPYAYAAVGAHVETVGSTGSFLALEFFDFDSSTWKKVGPNNEDCKVYIDALGSWLGATQELSAAITDYIIFRIVREGGDGTADPVLGNVHVHLFPAEAKDIAKAGILYLRELTPSVAIDAGDFPFSAEIPTHIYGSGTNLTNTADTVRALRPEKGTDTTGIHLQFGPTDTNRPRDLFPGAFVSEPFAVDQSVAAGPWELAAVAKKFASHDYAIPMMAVLLVRLVTGTWTVITAIVDEHNIEGAENLVYGQQRVSRKIMPGAAFDAEAGDIIVLEPWYHYDRMQNYATGHAQPGDETLAALYYDGEDDIPLSAGDHGAWTTGDYPASYLKPPVSLLLEGSPVCNNILSGDAIGADFGMNLCAFASTAAVQASSAQETTNDDVNYWPVYQSGTKATGLWDLELVTGDPTALNGDSYLLFSEDFLEGGDAWQNVTIAFPVEDYNHFWCRFFLRNITVAASDYEMGLYTPDFFQGVTFKYETTDDKIYLRNHCESGFAGYNTATPLTDAIGATDIVEFAYHVTVTSTSTGSSAGTNWKQYNCNWELYVRNISTSTTWSATGITGNVRAHPYLNNNANDWADWQLAILNQIRQAGIELHGWEFVDGSVHTNPFGF